MTEKQQITVAEPISQDFIDDFEGLDVDRLLPTMNVSKDMMQVEKKECPVTDDQLLGLYDEILKHCRDDRSKVDEVLANFVDMVMNEGDASSASKEAIVNLMKIKSDTADKMAKVADLMTRIVLKDKDTFPRYLAAQQQNHVVIESSKREMIKSINKIARSNKPIRLPEK